MMRRLADKFKYILFSLGFAACDHQPIYERPIEFVSAEIPVAVNWDTSGIEVDEYGMSKSKSTEKLIHRTTFRFFPKDGSEPFERYIGAGESIWSGTIVVPRGEYSVIVMNDAISDNYWLGSETFGEQSLHFENANDYDTFAAYIPISESYPSGYYWANYLGSHGFMRQALKLSSYSIDDFEVSQAMVDCYTEYIQNNSNTRPSYDEQIAAYDKLSDRDREMFRRLSEDDPKNNLENNLEDENGLDMRQLTKKVRVVLKVKNLSSAEEINGGILGFVNKVNMKTGEAFKEPKQMLSLSYFRFNGRKNWFDPDGNPTNAPSSGDNIYEDYVGDTSVDLLSFGRNFQDGMEEKYQLDLDVLYINGKLMDKQEVFTLDFDRDGMIDSPSRLPFDVTEQVKNEETPQGIDIYIYLQTLELDYSDGDINVNGWGEDNIVDL